VSINSRPDRRLPRFLALSLVLTLFGLARLALKVRLGHDPGAPGR
jgi:hypothetical protein